MAAAAEASNPSTPLKAAVAAKAASPTSSMKDVSAATMAPIPHATPHKVTAAAAPKASPPTPTRKAAEAQASSHEKAVPLIAEQPQPRKQLQQQQRAA